MVTIKELEKECANYNLTEYLKKCTMDELENCVRCILCDDVVGIRVNICDALLNELEYRKNIISKYSNCNNENINNCVQRKTAK